VARNVTLAILIVPISFTANVIRVMVLTLDHLPLRGRGGPGLPPRLCRHGAVHGGAAADHCRRFAAAICRQAAASSRCAGGKTVKLRLRNVLLLALMLAASGLAMALRPTEKIADQGARIDIARMFPEQFADWRVAPGIVPALVSPDVKEKLDAIYDQTLSRTYVNNDGQRIMLSIAYGGDQSGDKTQVHRPEFCYAAQGFQLSNNRESQITTESGVLPVRRLEAVQGSRNEPITYWITIGDEVTLPGLGRKLIQLRYGLTGKVPDGMLVRVSSIDQDVSKAYQLQDHFVRDMLAAINAQDRIRVAGRLIP
jgi:EpsI family protein